MLVDVLLEVFSNDELFLHRVGNELAPSLGAMKGGVLRVVAVKASSWSKATSAIALASIGS